MEYCTFIEKIKDYISETLGDDYRVNLDSVLKNNSVCLDCIIIQAEDERVTPSIYLRSYYEDYINGKDMSDIANDIINVYKNSSISDEKVLENLSDPTDFEGIKDRIVARMVNKDMNERLVSECPHIDYLDLMLTFHIIMDIYDEGDASIRVGNALFESWNISIDELAAAAMVNMLRLFPPRVEPLSNMAGEPLEKFGEENVLSGLYVLTNKNSAYGAVCMLYDGFMKRVALEFEADIVILPSSVHEVIFMKLGDDGELPKLLDMVEEVNDTQLPVQELLSYNLYVYSLKEDRFKIYPADFITVDDAVRY